MITGKVKIGIEEFKEDIISTCHRPPFSRRIPRLKWCEHQFWKRSNVFFENSADNCTWFGTCTFTGRYLSSQCIGGCRFDSVSKPYIFHECECLLWRVKLGLSFDMLASLFRVELGWGDDSACLRRSQFLVHRRAMILTLRLLHSMSMPYIQDVLLSIVKGRVRAFV